MLRQPISIARTALKRAVLDFGEQLDFTGPVTPTSSRWRSVRPWLMRRALQRWSSVYLGQLPDRIAGLEPRHQDLPVSLVTIIGSREVAQAGAMLMSFLTHVGRPRRIVVGDDGSLTAAQRALLSRLGPQVEFVAPLEEPFSCASSDELRSFADRSPYGKKLALLVQQTQTADHATVYADSDVLFFAGAAHLASLVCQQEPTTAYMVEPNQTSFDSRFEIGPHQLANSGFVIFAPGFDWQRSLQACRGAFGSPEHFTEMTAVHLAVHDNGGCVLPSDRYVLFYGDARSLCDSAPARPAAARHYVSPIRWKLWVAAFGGPLPAAYRLVAGRRFRGVADRPGVRPWGTTWPPPIRARQLALARGRYAGFVARRSASAKRLALGLRKRLPRSVRQVARDAGQFLGPSALASVGESLELLRAVGFAPTTIVDVGAFTGAWTEMVREVFPEAAVVMIEPLDSVRNQLADMARRSHGRITFQQTLLGAESGHEVSFHQMSTGSSVFEEQSDVPRTVTRKVTRRLDDVLGARHAELLKLDVQGYELEVLRGGPLALDAAEVVVLEASLISTNTGCPLIAEVLSFMDDVGFRLFDIAALSRRRDGALWQADLVFVRSGGPLVPSAWIDETNWG